MTALDQAFIKAFAQQNAPNRRAVAANVADSRASAIPRRRPRAERPRCTFPTCSAMCWRRSRSLPLPRRIP